MSQRKKFSSFQQMSSLFLISHGVLISIMLSKYMLLLILGSILKQVSVSSKNLKKFHNKTFADETYLCFLLFLR
jgi:hypothetical protein